VFSLRLFVVFSASWSGDGAVVISGLVLLLLTPLDVEYLAFSVFLVLPAQCSIVGFLYSLVPAACR